MRDDDYRRNSRNNERGRTYSYTSYSSNKKSGTNRSTSMSRNQTGKREISENDVKRKKTSKKKRRPVSYNQYKYKALLLITFVVFFIYISGYLISFFMRPKIATEVVNYGTIDVPKKIEGIIVRDEHVEKSPRDGQILYYFKDGDRVKKNSVICTVKNSENVDMINEKIDKINKEIISTQKDRESISTFKDDIDKIEEKVDETVVNFTNTFSENDFFSVYRLKNSVETEIDQRSQIWFLENNKGIKSLSDEKQKYEQELFQNQNNIASKTSGIVSLSYDGFEEIFTPKTIDKITSENFNMEYKGEDIINLSNIKTSSPVFKVVESNIYYIVSNIPTEYSSDIKEGDRKVLHTTVNNNESKSLNVKVSSVTQGEGYNKVVFSCNESISDFLDKRMLEFDISDEVCEGLKIPNSSIIEKSLLKIPKNALLESNNKNCVIKRSNGSDSLVELNIVRYDEDDDNDETTEHVYVLMDFNILKVGDTIVNGSGKDAGTFTLSEVSTYKGVYVVNSSVTEFKVIDPIGQNSEYTIAKITNSPYGLKIYDNIVSDAKIIDEKEEIS